MKQTKQMEFAEILLCSLQEVSDFYGEEYDTVLPVLMSRIQYCQSPTLREELTQLKRETKLHTILNEDM